VISFIFDATTSNCGREKYKTYYEHRTLEQPKAGSRSVQQPVKLGNDIKRRKQKAWNDKEQENSSSSTKECFIGYIGFIFSSVNPKNNNGEQQ